jgi:DNA-binding IclR family transcriptional regulator
MSQAAEKALCVLEHVAASPEPISAMTVASALRLDKSTCSRLLALLVELGWLTRNDRTRLFAAGPRLVGLSAVAAVGNRLQSILLPLLTELRAETQETVSFHRRAGDYRICIAGLESEHQIRRALPVGTVFALHAGPSGRAILAFIDGTRRDVAVAGLDQGEADSVRADLDQVIRSGIISTDGDSAHIIGVGGISAPVFDRDGVFGSLTIAGPLPRWHRERRSEAYASLLEAARDLSEALGGQHHAPFDRWIKACDTGGGTIRAIDSSATHLTAASDGARTHEGDV